MLGALAAIAYAAGQVALPTLIGLIIDDALLTGDVRQARALAFVLAGTACLVALLRSAYLYLFGHWGESSVLNLRRRILQQFPYKRLEDLDRQHSARLTALQIDDGGRVKDLFTRVAPEIILSIAQLTLNTLVILYRFGSAATPVFLLVPIYMITPALLAKPMRRNSEHLQEQRSQLIAKLQEAAEAIRTIKAFGAERWLLDRLTKPLREVRRQSLRLRVITLFHGVHYTVYWIAVSLIYWQGAKGVAAGSVTVGSLVALIAYLGFLEAPSSRLANVAPVYQTAMASARRILDFLSLQPESEPLSPVVKISSANRPLRVEFRDVTFTYHGRDRPALNRVSFVADPGQRIALVGPSGAGKTTIAALLLRFYEPLGGVIFLGERPLGQWPLEAVRHHVSIVSQNAFLFSSSLRENIVLGDQEATEAQIQHAAQAAAAEEFIHGLPERYDTLLGERGVGLSMGQAQRVAIARTVLRAPAVLILDEAMASLDAESEHQVQSALKRVMRNRTTLTITHRLDTARYADKIVLLDGGEVVAQGRHEHLLSRSPLYARLVERGLSTSPDQHSEPHPQDVGRIFR